LTVFRPHFLLASLLLIFAGVGCSQTREFRRDDLIVPGHRIGGIELGIERNALVRQLGFKPNFDQEWTLPGNGCEEHGMMWHFPADAAQSVEFGFEAGRLTWVSTRTRVFHTKSGTRVGTDLALLRRRCKRCRAFALLHFNSQVTGNVDLIYWIDNETGIAYQLAFEPRVLDEIIVFRPGSGFRPQSCIQPPRPFVELDPFATSIPERFYAK
jgi:hypothetical protein